MNTVYAVAKGKQPGIYTSWSTCKQHIQGYTRPVFRKFNTVHDARAFMQTQGVTDYIYDASQTPCDESETLDSFFKVRKTQKKKEDSTTQTFASVPESTEVQTRYIYTDGACAHNGKPHACAGAGVYFGNNDPRNRSERVHGKQSNNTAEITAVLLAHEQMCQEWETQPTNTYVVVSDSMYTIHYATDWGDKHENMGWTKPILNKTLVQKLYNTFKDEHRVTFLYVKAHTQNTDIHSLGNAHADRLANLAVGKSEIKLPIQKKNQKRKYVNVPFSLKEEANALGCKWDKHMKQWYYIIGIPHESVIEERFGF